jgi:hypothetical protein
VVVSAKGCLGVGRWQGLNGEHQGLVSVTIFNHCSGNKNWISGHSPDKGFKNYSIILQLMAKFKDTNGT